MPSYTGPHVSPKFTLPSNSKVYIEPSLAAAHWESEHKSAESRYQLNPEDADSRLRYVQSSVETGRLAQAQDALNQAPASTPVDPRLRFWQGVIHLLEGESEEARNLLEAVRYSVISTYPTIDLYLGLANSRVDRLGQRCDHLQRYLSSAPSGKHWNDVNRMAGQVLAEQCSAIQGET